MKNKSIISPLVKYIGIPIIRIWIGKVNGLENLPKNSAFIIAPNHCSYMEHPIISSIVVPYLNRKLHILTKKEHFENFSQKTWHGFWTRYITYIPIDRSKGEKALKAAEKYLKKDEVLLLYPEGTRSITGKMQRGKTGIARLILWSHVPVVPLGIRGTFEILPKGKNIPRPKKATLSFGKPMYFNKYYNRPITKKILRETTTKIMKEIAKLSGQKYNF